MRLPEADVAMIDRAAGLHDDFVRDAAVRAAEEVVMENTPVRMSAQGFNPFMAAIEAPATAVPELIALFKRKAPWAAGVNENWRLKS